MDAGLVVAAQGEREARKTILLRRPESERRPSPAKSRPGPARHPHRPQGAQGRIATVRRQLLPELSPRRAPSAKHRQLNEPYRIPLRGPEEGRRRTPLNLFDVIL